MFTYIQILTLKYPEVRCSTLGNGSIYEDLTWEAGDPLPSKQELDLAILEETRVIMWRKIQEKRETVRTGGGQGRNLLVSFR